MTCCLWWLVFGSDGLLGTEALQSCLPHQLDLRTGQLWAEGRSTLQFTSAETEVQGFLMTVAPFLVSGSSAGPLCLGGTVYKFNGGIWCGGGPHASGRLFAVG